MVARECLTPRLRKLMRTYFGGKMRIVQEGVSRRAVIENYAKYDFKKKRNSETLPEFDKWNWSSADAIDEELHRAGLKTGIPAAYLLWDMVQIVNAPW